MTYDRDLIAAIYFIQQQDEELAERMFNRLVEKNNQASLQNGYTTRNRLFIDAKAIYAVQRYCGEVNIFNKIPAIKALREQTGFGLKDAKDSIEEMIENKVFERNWVNDNQNMISPC